MEIRGKKKEKKWISKGKEQLYTRMIQVKPPEEEGLEWRRQEECFNKVIVYEGRETSK